MNIYYIDQLSDVAYQRLTRQSGSAISDTPERVREICDQVRLRGDSALAEYTRRFDNLEVGDFRVSGSEIDKALSDLDPSLRAALEIAAGSIRRFHASQAAIEPPVETFPGVVCWRERRPIASVGLYVPAGSAPLPSTVLMLGIPALLAGCSRIVLCSPPTSEGGVEPTVLAAAGLIGVREIYVAGGAQAIAAMAYGTETVPRVDKIYGPGNRYVAAAKRYVGSDPDGVAIDMIAGPSELLIIADDSADPRLVAADLLSQAEHDADAQVVLATCSEALAYATMQEVERQLLSLSRQDIIRASLAGSFVVVAGSVARAIRFSNDYAPEHLILNVQDPEQAAADVMAAGSVFLGSNAPVTAGDYASGTNHTLPTGGEARVSSGLSLESFQKTISFQAITRRGLEGLAPTLTALAEAEGLHAHLCAVTARTGSLVTSRRIS